MINNILNVNMKKSWDDTCEYPDVVYELKKAFFTISKLDVLHNLTMYKWESKINYSINDKYSCIKPVEKMTTTVDKRSNFNKFIIKGIYFIFKLNLKKVNIEEYLCCPECHGSLDFNKNIAICKICNMQYKQHRGYYDFRI